MFPLLLAIVLVVAVGGGALAYLSGNVPGTYRAALKGLKSKSRRTKAQAANQLGRYKKAESVGPLVRSLKIPDPFVRRACIEALGKIGKPAIESLVQAFAQQDEEIKFAAVEALCAISFVDVVEPLAKKLATTPAYMRRYVGEALVRLGPETFPFILKYAPDVGGVADDQAAELAAKREQFVEVLSRIGERNPTLLADAPASKDKERLFMGLALARMSDDRAQPILGKLLASRNPHIHAVALGALRDMKDAAVETLLGVLKDGNETAKEGVVDALVAMGGKGVDALSGLIRAEDPTVRLQAAIALGRMGNIRPLILVMWPKFAAKVAHVIEGAAKVRLDMLSDQAALKKAAELALAQGKMKKSYRAMYYIQALLIVLFPETVEAIDHPKIGKVLAIGGSPIDNAGFLRVTHLHPLARKTLELPRRGSRASARSTALAAK